MRCSADRKLRSNLSSNPALRYQFKGAMKRFDTVAQTCNAKACSAAHVPGISYGKSWTAVAYCDGDRLRIGPNLDPLSCCLAMMKSVIQSFLHHPVQAY